MKLLHNEVFFQSLPALLLRSFRPALQHPLSMTDLPSDSGTCCLGKASLLPHTLLGCVSYFRLQKQPPDVCFPDYASSGKVDSAAPALSALWLVHLRQAKPLGLSRSRRRTLFLSQQPEHVGSTQASLSGLQRNQQHSDRNITERVDLVCTQCINDTWRATLIVPYSWRDLDHRETGPATPWKSIRVL